MSWVTDKAVKRIFSTFKRLGKQIYKEDIDALKTINDALELQKKQNLETNRILAKLVAVYFINRIRINDDDINSCLRALSSHLKNPLDYHLEMLAVSLNVNQLRLYVDSLKIDVPNNEFDPIELEKYIQKWHTEYDDKVIARILNTYDLEYTKNSFIQTINEIIQTEKFYE